MESALPRALFYFGRYYWRLAVFPKAGGFRCLRHPGSIGHVLRTDRWVRPTERAGSEGVIKYGGRQQAYCIPESKKGRRFAAGCIEGLCSLRSRGDGGEKKLYSRKQEGSGAFGARVLSVVCCRTDRWVRPGNGCAFRAGSEGSYNAACWRPLPMAAKTKQPRLWRVEMHPFCRLWRRLPRRGRF